MTAVPQPVDPTTTPSVTGGNSAPRDTGAIRRAAEEFEAFFVSQMVAVMFAGLKTDGPFGGGDSEKVYRGMLQDEYGKAIARSGRLGIADSVMSEMLKTQEGARS